MTQSHRLVIVDDHPVFRLGLRALLDSDDRYEVVGEAGNVQTARQVLEELRPDVLVLDMLLEDGNASDLLSWSREALPSTRVLVISMLDEVLYAERCLRDGASGFLQKSEAPNLLLTALDQVMSGQVYLGPGATQRLMRRVAGGMPADANPLSQLTSRELEVFQLIGQGRRTTEIAEILHISPKTVESHQAKLRRKLGARDGVELLRLSVAWSQQDGKLPDLN